jgi:hypothetical protein
MKTVAIILGLMSAAFVYGITVGLVLGGLK